PLYMSPEQCAGYEVDARTDVYALGVMLYEMACARLPFDADNLMGLLTKHVYEQPIPPRDLGLSVEIPAGLEAIILRCLAKQPTSRYSTMAALREDLEALERGVTPRAVIAELDRSTPPRGRPPLAVALPPPAAPRSLEASPSRRPLWRFALLAVVVAIAAGGTFLALRSTPVALSMDKGSFPKSIAVEDPPPVEVEDPPPVEVEDPGPSLVMLESDPPGAEVYGPDGAVVGNTPIAVPRPAEGDAPIPYEIRLTRYRDRTVPVGPSTADTLRITLARGPSSHPTPPHGDTNTPPSTDGDATGFDTIEPIQNDLIDPFGDEDTPAGRRRRSGQQTER
ncbi:MAG: protein kinase, partial [Myxococcales bacterium]|nr:protein kinase [Myxococcales bacterium]